MSTIFIDDDDLIDRLQQVASRLQNPEQLTSVLERTLVSQSLLNFHNNGRPAWAGLADATLKSYARKGIVPTSILQRTAGGLHDSVQGEHDAHSATVMAGSGKSAPYAAIHQFGGQTGRGHKVTIPARPYLPMDKSGNLQPEAEQAIERDVAVFWQQLFD